MKRLEVVAQPDSKHSAVASPASPARRFHVVAGGGESASGVPLAEKPRIALAVSEKNPTFELLGAIQDCNFPLVRQLLGESGADLHVALKLIDRLHQHCRRELDLKGRAHPEAESISAQMVFYETVERLIVSHVADKL